MSIHTNSKPGMPQPGLDAAREGRTFCKFINGDAGLNAAATVIPDAGAYLDMELGKRYIVKCFYYALTTASDTVLFEIVTTSEPTGGGTVTAQTPKFVAGTTATADGSPVGPVALDPPLALTRSDGACIAMRVQTNDAGATVNVGFTGWEEDL